MQGLETREDLKELRQILLAMLKEIEGAASEGDVGRTKRLDAIMQRIDRILPAD